MAAELLGGAKGDVAILSATSTATNQNAWIEVMKKVVGKYPNVNLTTVVYGDDKQDKSYREAEGLIKTQPEPQGHHRADHGRHRGRRRRTSRTTGSSARCWSPASACPPKC